MSGKDQGEEKSLPASEKKLRDARKKGQVAQSKDMVVGAGTVLMLTYLWLTWESVRTRLIALMILPADSYSLPFRQAVDQAGVKAFELAALTLLPLVALVILASLLIHALVMKGFVFSTEPVKPKMEKIDPVSGFKRIFSLKNLVELIKSMLKTVFLAAAAVTLVLLGLDNLLKSPACGTACVAEAFKSLMKPLSIGFALIFLLFALIDIGVQRWLFLREMKMTRTEFKRERKDMEGDPVMRQERLRRQREFVAGRSVPTGIRNATLLITDGRKAAVGLRYVENETPIPAVVCKGREALATKFIAEAKRLRLPITPDPPLANALLTETPIGNFVDQAHFHAIARILYQS